MKSTVWYLYLAAQSDIKNLSNSVCAYGGVLYSLEILPQACTVHVRSTYTNLIFSLAIYVLEYYTVRNVMSCLSAI